MLALKPPPASSAGVSCERVPSHTRCSCCAITGRNTGCVANAASSLHRSSLGALGRQLPRPHHPAALEAATLLRLGVHRVAAALQKALHRRQAAAHVVNLGRQLSHQAPGVVRQALEHLQLAALHIDLLKGSFGEGRTMRVDAPQACIC